MELTLKILNEYKELKDMFKDKYDCELTIEQDKKYKITLEFLIYNGYLERGKYLRSTNYPKLEKFYLFEQNFKNEIKKLTNLDEEITNLEKLESLISEIDSLIPIRNGIDSAEYKTWRRKLDKFIVHLFGEDSKEKLEIDRLDCIYVIRIMSVGTDISTLKYNFYKEQLFKIQSTLQSYKNDAIEKDDGINIVENLESEPPKMKQKKIFISHSSKDKEYVNELVKLLRLIGLKKDNLFCSSVNGYGIPLGKNIFEYLREEFNNFELHVIFVHSNNFYDSPICLNEMGATWVVKYKHTSIILPDFDMNRMTGVISKEDIAIRLDGDDVNSRLTELKNELINDFNLDDEDSIIWEDNRNDFIKKVIELSQQSN